VGRDSIFVIATGYGLDRPGMETRRRRDFFTLQDWPWDPPAAFKMGTGSFLAKKLPGRGIYNTPPSRAAVKEKVEL